MGFISSGTLALASAYAKRELQPLVEYLEKQGVPMNQIINAIDSFVKILVGILGLLSVAVYYLIQTNVF